MLTVIIMTVVCIGTAILALSVVATTTLLVCAILDERQKQCKSLLPVGHGCSVYCVRQNGHWGSHKSYAGDTWGDLK